MASPFGIQLDSLADMTAFGVATALLSYNWLLLKRPELLILSGIVSCLVALTSAIRLARFNVGEKSGFYFAGIPTTSTAKIVSDQLSHKATTKGKSNQTGIFCNCLSFG